MQKINIILIGFGRVGRAFCELLKEKYDFYRERYGLLLELKGIIRKSGTVLLSGTGQLEAMAGSQDSGQFEPSNWSQIFNLEDMLEEYKSGVVVDCTPSNLKTGEPGYSLMRTALEKGWHLVTASKGALVVHPAELTALAQQKQVVIKASGATAAALPTLDVGLRSLAGAEILAIEGILNGTTNYILTRMAEGLDFSQALMEASEKGIAESNPVQDIEGWDTAAKMVIIANKVLGTEIKLSEVKVSGLRGINGKLVARAASLSKTIKLIGRCSRENPDAPWKVEVGLALLDSDHPLAGVSGSNKGIIFYTDCMGHIVLTGGKSDPRGAAAALIKDIISIYWFDF